MKSTNGCGETEIKKEKKGLNAIQNGLMSIASAGVIVIADATQLSFA
ncbi:MAG: hypothetical protein LBG63_03345 [Candidatus Methanoplasma sp.]|nr:hypothetical protein [Candidatus Methanoplasma sp.]